MPKFRVEMEDGKTFQVEADSQPTPEEVQSYIASQDGGGKFYTGKQQELVEVNEQSALNAKQNLILGAINDPIKKQEFLAKEFSGRNVEQNELGEFFVDGKPINPEGIDASDLFRTVLKVPPFVGQVVGNLVGFGAGGGPVSPTSVPMSMAGGVAGAAAGRVTTDFIAKSLGLDVSGKEFIKNAAEEALYATAGEGMGLAAGMAVKGMARKGVSKVASNNKGMANLYTKITDKIGPETSADLLEFVAGVKPGTGEAGGKYALDKTLNGNRKFGAVVNENTMSPTFAPKKINEFLYGKPDIPQILLETEHNGVQRGNVLLAKQIEKINNDNYDLLISSITNDKIDKTVCDNLRRFGSEQVFSKSNLDDKTAYSIAKNIQDVAYGETERLGKELGEQYGRVLKERGGNTLTNIPVEAVQSLEQLAKKIDGLNISGSKQLLDLVKRFRVGEDFTQPMRKLTMHQAYNLNMKIDDVADKVFKGEVSPTIKKEFLEFTRTWRKGFQESFGTSKLAERYGLFKDLADEARIGMSNSVDMYNNAILSYGKQKEPFVDRLKNVLTAVRGNKGIQIIDDIEKFATAQRFKGLSVDATSKPLYNFFNNSQIISNGTSIDPRGQLFKEIGTNLGNINPKLNIYRHAMDNITAKEFTTGSANALRIGFIASMLGLGGFLGGPLGSVATMAMAMKLTKPSSLAKIIGNLEKGSAGKGVVAKAGQQASKIKSGLSSQKSKALINALASKALQNKEKK